MPGPKPPHCSVEVLLRERQWLHQLARHLARDEQAAADLAQETWLAALGRRPSTATPVRGWLAAVLRRRLANQRRTERRRVVRERAVARPEAAPVDTAELCARAELQRLVADGVLALEEPFRTTVLLRYFDDLPPRRIAARLGVPVETVRSRLRRALERMRARLDATHGGRRGAWCLPLLALAGVSPRAAGTGMLPGALAMTAKTKLAVSIPLLLCAVLATVTLVLPLADPPGVDRAGPARSEIATRVPQRPAHDKAPPRATRDTALAPVTVSGIVVRPDHTPASGARVVVRSGTDPREALGRVLTDAQGRFVLSCRQGVPVVLAAHSAGHAVARSPLFWTRADLAGVRLRLQPAATLRGTVVDEKGAPVEAASVRATSDQAVPLAQTTTAADGSFLLADLPLRAVELVATLPDGSEGRLAGVQLPSPPVRLRLVQASRHAGRVVDDTGRPIEDAILRVEDARGAVLARARSDDAGRFALHLPPRSATLLLVARHPDSGGAAVALPPDRREELVVQLRPERRLAGLVRCDGDGSPAPHARIVVYDGPTGFPRPQSAQAGADGRFEVVLRAEGPAQVALDPHEPRYRLVGEPLVRVAPRSRNDDRAEVTLIVQPRPSVLGRVEDEAGRPLGGVEVGPIVGSPARIPVAPGTGATLTGPDGRFRLDGVPLDFGRCALYARCAGRPPLRTAPLVAAEGPNTPIRIVIRLGRGGQLSGRALDGDGAPLAGARVRVDTPDETLGPVGPFAWTAADGRFSIHGVGAGVRAVHVEHPTHLPLRRSVRVEDGGTAAVGDLRLAGAPVLEGTVVRSDGRVAADAAVLLVADSGARTVRGGTDADGRFRLVARAVGGHRVVTHAAGSPPAETRVELPTDRECNIRLPQGRLLEGRVEDARGRPVAGASVIAWRDGTDRGPGDQTGGTTDRHGAFSFELTGTGPLRLRASAPGLAFEETRLAAPRTGLVVRARPSVEISGAVRDEAGEPAPGATVVLRPLDTAGRAVTCRTGKDGRFTAMGLVGSRFRLLADHPDHAPYEGETALGAGGVDIVLRAGLAIAGQVTGAGDLPCDMLFVTAVPEGGSGRQRTASIDPRGHFLIRGLAPGTYELHVSQGAIGSRVEARLSDVPAGARGIALPLNPKPEGERR